MCLNSKSTGSLFGKVNMLVILSTFVAKFKVVVYFCSLEQVVLGT